ncbi:MAG: trypsin-like peptidase domain-containing protein [Patescibacteria group bacterium]|nr:trypsin-like peptidase domain-containing protein [Patescibacteria group bacterium]
MKNKIVYLSAAVLSGALGAVLVLSLAPFVRPQISLLMQKKPVDNGEEKVIQPQSPMLAAEKPDDERVVQVVKQAQPAVVAVLVYADIPSQQANNQFYLQDPLFEQFFGPQPQVPQVPSADGPQRIAGGSGFFVSADGLIVTNKHVVQFNGLAQDKVHYKIQMSTDKTYDAKLLAADPVLDLAFLKVENAGDVRFTYLELGDSSQLMPGQSVIAIGNALDEFRNTVTQGVVSGLNRRIVAGDGVESEVIEEAIQTDAAINPGNSGGPLLDLNGKVVGVNSAVSDRGQNLGFAIPSHVIKRDLDSINKDGRIARPFLGVRYIMVTPELIKANQLKVDHGALIMRGENRSELAISPGSPADKAGLKENDIILEVDGTAIDENHSLSSLVGKHAVGDEVTLKVYSAGEETMIKAKLDEMKP